MAKRFWMAAAFGVAAIFALGVALSPERDVRLSVVGDRADEIADRLGGGPEPDPTVTIVTLARRQNLQHLPDIAALCRFDCGVDAAGQVVLTRLRFGATRKVVLFFLDDFGGDLDCVAARARLELAMLRVTQIPCAPQVVRDAVWILPAGLGRA